MEITYRSPNVQLTSQGLATAAGPGVAVFGFTCVEFACLTELGRCSRSIAVSSKKLVVVDAIVKYLQFWIVGYNNNEFTGILAI